MYGYIKINTSPSYYYYEDFWGCRKHTFIPPKLENTSFKDKPRPEPLKITDLNINADIFSPKSSIKSPIDIFINQVKNNQSFFNFNEIECEELETNLLEKTIKQKRNK